MAVSLLKMVRSPIRNHCRKALKELYRLPSIGMCACQNENSNYERCSPCMFLTCAISLCVLAVAPQVECLPGLIRLDLMFSMTL